MSALSPGSNYIRRKVELTKGRMCVSFSLGSSSNAGGLGRWVDGWVDGSYFFPCLLLVAPRVTTSLPDWSAMRLGRRHSRRRSRLGVVSSGCLYRLPDLSLPPCRACAVTVCSFRLVFLSLVCTIPFFVSFLFVPPTTSR